MRKWNVIRRISLFLIIGIILAWGMNEISYIFLKTDASRAPGTIELVIPAGTAARVARGDKEPSIPEGMVFVIGDTLVVRNDDSLDHQLGPLFIPSGTSATLKFNTAEKMSYSCSFSASKAFGMDVQLPVTSFTRFTGAVLAGLPLGVLIALYSFVLQPTVSKKPA